MKRVKLKYESCQPGDPNFDGAEEYRLYQEENERRQMLAEKTKATEIAFEAGIKEGIRRVIDVMEGIEQNAIIGPNAALMKEILARLYRMGLDR